MKVGIVGLGHLGFVTAACLSQNHVVVGIGDKLNCPKDEPNLDNMMASGFARNNLAIDVGINALSTVDVVWVTYDTPVDKNDCADIKYVKDRIIGVMTFIKKEIPIIISSQLPLGSIASLENKFPDHIFICIPENLRHGTAVENFLYPDRIVVGIRKQEHYEIISPLLTGKTVVIMNIESAEMVKHAINSFLAIEITFANELGDICKSFDISYDEVLKGLLTDSRIGLKARLKTGSAYKGGTLARDIKYLINLSVTTGLFGYVKKSNDRRLKRENNG